MNSNSDNPKVGKDFQRKVLSIAQKTFNMPFDEEKVVPVGNPPKEHRFDVVSADGDIIIECKGNVLALDKVGKNYSGTTFPGGHVEAGETFIESVIREVFEETGLTIKNPKLMGIYHWISGDVRNVGFLYRTDEFEGKLISSDEGRVYWISEKDYLKKSLAPGMQQVWQIMHSDVPMECLQTITEEGIIAKIQ